MAAYSLSRASCHPQINSSPYLTSQMLDACHYMRRLPARLATDHLSAPPASNASHARLHGCRPLPPPKDVGRLHSVIESRHGTCPASLPAIEVTMQGHPKTTMDPNAAPTINHFSVLPRLHCEPC
jgi:hypothetical protein